MWGALNLVPNAVNQPRLQIVNTTVLEEPASFNAPLLVVDPSHDQQFLKIINWPAIHGKTLPQAGANCVLSYDSSAFLRCLWWDGTYT